MEHCNGVTNLARAISTYFSSYAFSMSLLLCGSEGNIVKSSLVASWLVNPGLKSSYV